ncbi:hypothetical protein P872_18500 [Rhodonellum psychrophilum GCM71 = DSM 17998]|uniref:Phage tail protein n=2 Tax=Rhodonellum TaxID=336827 RepID=U5C2K2_9BACT|nr:MULTISPECIES: phage tail tube protein [Rhodonellum]ERM82387.1 hypothetical protein P872_18500 [Rhodonellum psychrophilum GCM71 = DSM 17998]SDZ35675.1 phage major tail protein, TP901-1 family [Rhodonellum ikkaensis]
MNNIDGNKILIKLNPDSEAGDTTIVLAGQTGASIEINKEMIEYTSKTTTVGGIPVRKYLPTRSTSTISVESLYDPTGDLTQDEILEMCYNGVYVRFTLGHTGAGSKNVSGKGYISSASNDFGMDSTSTGSFTIQVDGGLTFAVTP